MSTPSMAPLCRRLVAAAANLTTAIYLSLVPRWLVALLRPGPFLPLVESKIRELCKRAISRLPNIQLFLYHRLTALVSARLMSLSSRRHRRCLLLPLVSSPSSAGHHHLLAPSATPSPTLPGTSDALTGADSYELQPFQQEGPHLRDSGETVTPFW